uniref:Ubiquitin n=1 Tax=Solanum tuberosum TaxID=4113 RepID=M1DZP2_SOLTU
MLKTHDDMWNHIKERYDIHEVGKDWALGAIKLAWRGYKCRLKKMHFYAYADDATRMAKRPKFDLESVFKEILEHWNSDEAKGDSGPSSQTVDDELMQKKIEEMEERMQEKFNAQKDTMERNVTVNIIAQLQRLNLGLTLDPNMLRFTVGSLGDGAVIQLINRPIVGYNNHG